LVYVSMLVSDHTDLPGLTTTTIYTVRKGLNGT